MGFPNSLLAFSGEMKSLSLISCYKSKISLKISAIFAVICAAFSFGSCGDETVMVFKKEIDPNMINWSVLIIIVCFQFRKISLYLLTREKRVFS